MSQRKTLVVLGVVCLWASRIDAADPLGPCYGGSSDIYKYEVQASADSYGYYWYSDSIYLSGSAGQQFDISVRTLLGTYMSGIQAWSFGLEHDTSELEYYGGSMELTGVTVQGTDTETVKSGYPPDFEATEVRAGYDGFTQGVIIDNNSQVTLGPVDGFVTAGACYRITMPYSMSYCAITLKFTHDIGDPPIESVMTDDGESANPCAKNLTIYLYQSSPGYTGCIMGGSWRSGSRSAASSMKMPEELKALMAADPRLQVAAGEEANAALGDGGGGQAGDPEDFLTKRITRGDEPDSDSRHVRLNGGTAAVPAGDFAVFSSQAENLVQETVPASTFQIYRVDYANAAGMQIELMSVDQQGAVPPEGKDSHRPSTSDDGAKVVFDTEASLSPFLDADHLSDVYVRDVGASQTRLLSYTKTIVRPLSEWNNHATNDWQSCRRDSLFPSISGDGKYAAFTSSDPTIDRHVAQDGVDPFQPDDEMVYRVDTDGVEDVDDQDAAETHIVSVAPLNGAPTAADFVLPLSNMTTASQPPGSQEIHSGGRAVSDDGRFVVFFGAVDPFRGWPAAGEPARIYIRDMNAEGADPDIGFQIWPVAREISQNVSLGECRRPSISGEPINPGSHDYAVSFHAKWVDAQNGPQEGILWSQFDEALDPFQEWPALPWWLAGGADPGVDQASGYLQSQLSPDGHWMVFASSDPNAVGTPTNGLQHIFAAELETEVVGENLEFTGYAEFSQASVAGAPDALTEADDGASFNPDVVLLESADHVRKVQVAFETDATNLVLEENLIEERDVLLREFPMLNEFRRGDANVDGGVNVSDPIFILNHLFVSGPGSSCLDTEDVNDDGSVNITDPVFLLNHLFAGGGPPGAPFPDCGVDPTPNDGVTCDVYETEC